MCFGWDRFPTDFTTDTKQQLWELSGAHPRVSSVQTRAYRRPACVVGEKVWKIRPGSEVFFKRGNHDSDFAF